MKPSTPVLTVSSLHAAYGKNEVLRGVSLHVAAGEISAVIGHNGSGKTTLLRCILGIKRPTSGNVSLRGGAWGSPNMAMLRQGKAVFGSMTVKENLGLSTLGLSREQQSERLQSSLRANPDLAKRVDDPAGTLSGGQQRLLGIAMALARRPKVLLLDEPCAALSDTLAEQILQRIRTWCAESQAAAVVVEQKVKKVLTIADAVNVLRNGTWAFSGSPDELKGDRLAQIYL